MLIIALILMTLGKKITLKDRLLLSQAVNTNSLQGLVKLTKRIFKYTFTLEIIGAVVIAFRFVPLYDWGPGLFKALFQSVSAFCNAGFDVLGDSSMIPFATDKVVGLTCMILTSFAGLGFLVWTDIANGIKVGVREKYSFVRIIRKFSLHTKVVLIMHVLLFTIGTVSFYLLEHHNPGTIGNFSLSNQLFIAAFQSVSARTSGFASINLSNLTDMTKLVLALCMLVGGGSGSMAGGIKTTTLFVLIVGVYQYILGNKLINIFKKSIPNETFMKAVSVFLIAIIVLVFSQFTLMANSQIDSLDLFFESISAFATVGLSVGALMKMNLLCRGVIIILMFIGRIGTITMALSFVMKKPKEKALVVYAKEEVIVG